MVTGVTISHEVAPIDRSCAQIVREEPTLVNVRITPGLFIGDFAKAIHVSKIHEPEPVSGHGGHGLAMGVVALETVLIAKSRKHMGTVKVPFVSEPKLFAHPEVRVQI